MATSGMGNPSHQDWTPVVLRKTKKVVVPPTTAPPSAASAEARLEAETDVAKRSTVGRELGTKIMQARMAKKLSQKQLAMGCGLQASVVQSYENGKAVPDHGILGKMERCLGCSLRSKKKRRN